MGKNWLAWGGGFSIFDFRFSIADRNWYAVRIHAGNETGSWGRAESVCELRVCDIPISELGLNFEYCL
jgi:hypothetical protein